jgi:hypothetical protein
MAIGVDDFVVVEDVVSRNEVALQLPWLSEIFL